MSLSSSCCRLFSVSNPGFFLRLREENRQFTFTVIVFGFVEHFPSVWILIKMKRTRRIRRRISRDELLPDENTTVGSSSQLLKDTLAFCYLYLRRSYSQ